MPDIFDFVGGPVLTIFLIIIIVVLLVAFVSSRYKVAAANEALVVSGARDRSSGGQRTIKVVRGGGVLVIPLRHKVGKLKLTARQINVALADAVTRQGIKVAVQGVRHSRSGPTTRPSGTPRNASSRPKRMRSI